MDLPDVYGMILWCVLHVDTVCTTGSSSHSGQGSASAAADASARGEKMRRKANDKTVTTDMSTM